MMNTPLKEWLNHTIAELEEERDAVPGAVNEDAAMALAAMKLALSTLEAEPVAYIFKHPAGRLFWSLTDESNKGQSDVMPVYTAQPAPVFVPDELTREEYKRRFMEDDDFDVKWSTKTGHGFRVFQYRFSDSFGGIQGNLAQVAARKTLSASVAGNSAQLDRIDEVIVNEKEATARSLLSLQTDVNGNKASINSLNQTFSDYA